MISSTSTQTDGQHALIARVREHTLPEDAIPIIETYDEVIGARDRFLWKWAHHLFPEFTLSCVDPRHVDEVRDAKLFGLVFVSVLDDVAEMQQDTATFEEAAKIPFEHKTVARDREGADPEVLDFASDVWERFAPAIRESPRAAEFGGIVDFDLEQILNSMRYSCIANRNVEFVTGSELRTYDAHNMMLYGFADVDVLHSPSFDRAEMATLRQVVERAQRMARIGNWITTWERELAEGDFVSGVVVYALENDIVTVDELMALRGSPRPETVDELASTIRANAVEGVFLTQWREELARARRLEGDVRSVDLGSYLDGLETVMEYHLASRGMK